ncbi:hypothetical protein HK102_007387 [Quaeritorhiza haematococci]|nr:hypothetical protein HK102_007387 [Quaeritorhiza haematococci]
MYFRTAPYLDSSAQREVSSGKGVNIGQQQQKQQQQQKPAAGMSGSIASTAKNGGNSTIGILKQLFPVVPAGASNTKFATTTTQKANGSRAGDVATRVISADLAEAVNNIYPPRSSVTSSSSTSSSGRPSTVGLAPGLEDSEIGSRAKADQKRQLYPMQRKDEKSGKQKRSTDTQQKALQPPQPQQEQQNSQTRKVVQQKRAHRSQRQREEERLRSRRRVVLIIARAALQSRQQRNKIGNVEDAMTSTSSRSSSNIVDEYGSKGSMANLNFGMLAAHAPKTHEQRRSSPALQSTHGNSSKEEGHNYLANASNRKGPNGKLETRSTLSILKSVEMSSTNSELLTAPPPSRAQSYLLAEMARSMLQKQEVAKEQKQGQQISHSILRPSSALGNESNSELSIVPPPSRAQSTTLFDGPSPHIKFTSSGEVKHRVKATPNKSKLGRDSDETTIERDAESTQVNPKTGARCSAPTAKTEAAVARQQDARQTNLGIDAFVLMCMLFAFVATFALLNVIILQDTTGVHGPTWNEALEKVGRWMTVLLQNGML